MPEHTHHHAHHSAKEHQPEYEYLKIKATVYNNTGALMRLTGSNLSWGTWNTSPTDVLHNNSIYFEAGGRASSPSGVTGWVKWTLESSDMQSPTIYATFDNPAVGSDTVSITCTPNTVHVQADQSGGDDDTVTYTVG